MKTSICPLCDRKIYQDTEFTDLDGSPVAIAYITPTPRYAACPALSCTHNLPITTKIINMVTTGPIPLPSPTPTPTPHDE
jgi:hypothetical protein